MASSFVQWRRFDFFVHNFLDKKENNKISSFKSSLANGQDSNESLDTFAKLKQIKITCSDSGRGMIILGDQNGWIHKLDNNFEMESFQAYDYEVIAVQQIIQNPYLITSGVDESNKNIIKIWNQDRIDPHKQMPTCIRHIKNSLVISPTVGSKITCLKATDTLTFMCIGYNNGNLVTIRGDLLKERSCKHKRIELCKDEITSILMKGNYQNASTNFLNNRLLPIALKQQNKQVTSFITTSNQIYFFEMKNEIEKFKLIENDFGSTTGRDCCLIGGDNKHFGNYHFILGKENAIFFYENDGRGKALPLYKDIYVRIDKEKLVLHWFKDYLIVVNKENQSSPNNLTDSIIQTNFKDQLTIYDIFNNYIAFSATLSSINQIFAEWGYIFILLNDGRLVQIREKDMNSKLDLLFKKQQYSLAIKLAENQNFNSDNLTDIYKEYGDHQFKQRDFEGAIDKYVKTIGKLEPSYVIKRYKDGQKVKYLTTYLYHLHKEGLANKDHTLLYLNCLTKSENKSNLINFLQNFKNEKQLQDNDEFNSQLLDVQNAISVLRKSKLYDEALYLAELFKCYDSYFKIEIEDKGNYLGAINFIQNKLPNEKDLFFNQYFVKYSKLLFKHKPAETTQLLKQMCKKTLTMETATNEEKQKKSFFYIDILMSKPEKLIEFLEFLQKENPDFKERTISNTLIELYLQNYRATDDLLAKKELEDKILNLLKDENSEYDNERAMILCQVNKFDEGMKYLYEKLGMYDILIFQCIEGRNDDQIIKICENHGNQNHDLWVKAFLYFCKLNSTDNLKREKCLLRTIDEITRRKLLPLISITNLLSTNETINLQMVKNYLINSLAKENEIITKDESSIKQYKNETDRIREDIEKIEQNGKIFQARKCSICYNLLDLPVVHFYCNHSFHLHCHESHCGENDNECCLCLLAHKKVLDAAENNQKIINKELNKKFIDNINQSDTDSYAIVANYYSKNLF